MAHSREQDPGEGPASFLEGGGEQGQRIAGNRANPTEGAEGALRHTESQLRVIIDALPTLISYIDADYVYRLNNRAYEEWFKHGRNEITGHHVRDVLGEAAWQVIGPKIEAALAGEMITYEAEVAYKDAGRRWINATYVPHSVAEGEVSGVIVLVNDVTQRKQAEAALRLTEDRLALELEATTRLHALSSRLLSADDLSVALDDVLENAMVTCGADYGNIQLINQQTRLLEIVAQRGFGSVFLEYFGTMGIDEGSAAARTLCSGERIAIEDVELDPDYLPHRHIAASAGYRSVQSTPLKSHDGNIVGMLSTYFRFPHRLSDRDERLLDLYARHAADMIERLRYEAALKDADRRKDEFLATLAHELRNPLAPIRNGLQVLRLGGMEGDLAEDARKMMERQLSQLVRLIDDLLDLSRISRGKIELKKERVELARVIQHAIETSRPLIDEANHELLMEVPDSPIFVDADTTRLAQVFSNLLNNAAKYTEQGGRVRLAVQRGDGEVLISVKDNGLGIPAHMLPKVFEMFTQVDRNLDRSQGGLGIGLSIVKRLVEMHDGTVDVKSDGHGMGSEFLVRMPVVRAVATENFSDEKAAGPSNRWRILVVDDNRDAAMSLLMMLKLMGHEVKTAHDGLEALEVAAAYRPDLILLDIGMPRLDGYQAARRIREQSWGKRVILVALSGWGQPEDRQKAQDAGFDSHLVKPADPAAIEILLASLAEQTA